MLLCLLWMLTPTGLIAEALAQPPLSNGTVKRRVPDEWSVASSSSTKRLNSRELQSSTLSMWADNDLRLR